MEKKESAKERILRTASALFYSEGVRAVGIDRIIEESGVAKASFYRNFASKDDLVVAYLEYRHGINMDNMDKAKRHYPDNPVKQLYELLHGLVVRAENVVYRGCSLMNTSVEFPDKDHPGNRKAAAFRQELWDGIEAIAREAGAKDAKALSAQLRMLISGAIMVSSMDRSVFNAEEFSNTLRLLINQQIDGADTAMRKLSV
ncbi:TetR/AcrR family transcriptional regulator [Paenibacillus sepulcri]|uniref:TetR/AcrR family transcriptional regulator n=1 Tax=Paenibacillus sepulcri TaxID=359917 RepID=A0ABS7CAT7_9BACL|nr:TetR/AcrR family transcriptional regulator [Paenibacillus sepulcri]